MIKSNIYYSSLYDLYGKLLSDKQRCIFEDYYFDNLQVEEIAANNGVSKNAISKQLIAIKSRLEYYEECLHFCKKFNRLQEVFKDDASIINKINECLND